MSAWGAVCSNGNSLDFCPLHPGLILLYLWLSIICILGILGKTWYWLDLLFVKTWFDYPNVCILLRLNSLPLVKKMRFFKTGPEPTSVRIPPLPGQAGYYPVLFYSARGGHSRGGRRHMPCPSVLLFRGSGQSFQSKVLPQITEAQE